MIDIWDTAENFQAFGGELMPILGALGVEMPAPSIRPVQNVIRPPV